MTPAIYSPNLSMLQIYQLLADNAVEASSALRCTHYDAFRFFHPSAQPMKSVSMPTRDFQEENEQPGMLAKESAQIFGRYFGTKWIR